jgi:hypothetical protein
MAVTMKNDLLDCNALQSGENPTFRISSHLPNSFCWFLVWLTPLPWNGAICSSKTSGSLSTTRHYNPEDHTLREDIELGTGNIVFHLISTSVFTVSIMQGFSSFVKSLRLVSHCHISLACFPFSTRHVSFCILPSSGIFLASNKKTDFNSLMFYTFNVYYFFNLN